MLEESISGIRENFVCGIRECQALESGIHLGESGILLTIAIQNPSSTDKERDPESTARNPQSKTVLVSLIWGDE